MRSDGAGVSAPATIGASLTGPLADRSVGRLPTVLDGHNLLGNLDRLDFVDNPMLLVGYNSLVNWSSVPGRGWAPRSDGDVFALVAGVVTFVACLPRLQGDLETVSAVFLLAVIERLESRWQQPSDYGNRRAEEPCRGQQLCSLSGGILPK